MKIFFKKNIKFILGIFVGLIIVGIIGYVVAENIAASNITYTNNNQSTVDGALDDLYDKANAVPVKCYNGVCGKLSYKYWNDNGSGTTYQKNAVPTGSGLNGTYTSRVAFANAYSNFDSDSRYIRTVLIDENVVGHEACLYYNNREFCIAPNYWAGTIGTDEAAGTNTKIKLQRDMEAALGTTATSCYSSSLEGDADCWFGSFSCFAYYDGNVDCGGVNNCTVYSDGSASCYS